MAMRKLGRLAALGLGLGLLGACGTPPASTPGGGAGSAPTPGPTLAPGNPAPGGGAPPSPDAFATATLSGKVFAARNATVTGTGNLPSGYQPIPDGATVTVTPEGAFGNPVTTTVKGGSYSISGVPAHTRLLVTVSYPGLASRTLETVVTGSTGTLDFDAGDGGYLVDQPEVVAVSAQPMAGDRLDPDQSLVFTLTYSEPLDPATFDPKAITLTSPDIPGLDLTDGTTLLGDTVTVQMTSPTTVVLATHGPVANLRKGHPYPTVLLSFGQGLFAEAASGIVLGGAPQTVGGSHLSATGPEDSTPTVAFHFWTNDSYPSLTGMTVLGPAMIGKLAGTAVKLAWSEPMVVMESAKQASGSYDPSVLLPSSYQVATASTKVGPFGGSASLEELAFSSPTRMAGTLVGVQSGDWVRITPMCANPEGNAATGSLLVEIP